MKNISWLTEKLPSKQIIKLRSEPDYYGVSHIIASRMAKTKVPRSFAGWIHGWNYFPIMHVRQLAYWGGSKDVHLVATENDVQALKGFGFNKAKAVGLPFLYSNNIQVPRESGTLLVMPCHSLPYTKHNWDQKNYVDQVAALKPYFSEIVACVHSTCVDKGYWISEFEQQDIPWIVGATVDDKNAFQRMKTIFSSFEYMTTNSLGSHIPYASYCGCKVSIYGSYPTFSAKDFENDPFYQEHPDLLEKSMSYYGEKWAKESFPDFFVHPSKSMARNKWAEEVLGLQHKKSDIEIADLLGWSLSGQAKGYFLSGSKKIKRLIRSHIECSVPLNHGHFN